MSVRYPSSRGYVAYRILYEQKRIVRQCTGNCDHAALRVPLLEGRIAAVTGLDGKPVASKEETVERSRYVVVETERRGVHRLEIALAAG